MSAPLKAAVIGVGSMGRHHARVYTQIEQTQLVGIADLSQEAGKQIASQHNVKAYTDYHELLEKERPDVVTVAVPTKHHRIVVEEVMKVGCDVLVEKPIAATVTEGEELIALAQELNRNLMVGHIVRFSPVIQALKDHLEAGELGKIFQIVCRRVGPFPSRIQDVGVVIDLAPHDLDVMRFISGDDPVRIFAETEQQIHTAHEDLLTGLLKFKSGITGMLEINWLTPMKIREVAVLGEHGMFLANDLTQDLYFYENAEAVGIGWNHLSILKGVSEGKMVKYPVRRYEPLRAELEAFTSAVINGEPMPVQGEDGLAALRLALALVQSADEHQIIEV